MVKPKYIDMSENILKLYHTRGLAHLFFLFGKDSSRPAPSVRVQTAPRVRSEVQLCQMNQVKGH